MTNMELDHEKMMEYGHELFKELGMSYYSQSHKMNGSIGYGVKTDTNEPCFYVYIWNNVKRPALIKWRGYPIVYSIGGGGPIAL